MFKLVMKQFSDALGTSPCTTRRVSVDRWIWWARKWNWPKKMLLKVKTSPMRWTKYEGFPAGISLSQSWTCPTSYRFSCGQYFSWYGLISLQSQPLSNTQIWLAELAMELNDWMFQHAMFAETEGYLVAHPIRVDYDLEVHLWQGSVELIHSQLGRTDDSWNEAASFTNSNTDNSEERDIYIYTYYV